MPPGQPSNTLASDALPEKRRVALASLAAALFLAVAKLVVGLATNSLGILAEAAHSALDLVAAGVTFWAVQISGRPADHDHTYGHGKFENLSALLETLLLLATCAWIIREALGRLLLGRHPPVDANLWAFGVILVSIVVDYSRSKALYRVARKYNSQALEADALHFSTDIWSSLVVLLGLLSVRVATAAGIEWLTKADAVAALGVALLVISVSFRLGRRSVDDLLDRIPAGLQERVADAAAGVSRVEQVSQVRLRRSGGEFFADVTIAVDQATPFEQAHQIADVVEAAVRSVVARADVVVHVEPVADARAGLLKTVRLVAARRGLGAHGIRVYDHRGRRALELHLEVSEGLQLNQAHDEVTAFEQELRRAVPGLDRIVTHIEPAGDRTATRQAEPVGATEIRRVLERFAQSQATKLHVHDVEVQRAGGELAVSLHCALAPQITIIDAHTLSQRMEDYLRGEVANLGRVVIHVEPPETGRQSR